MKKPKKKSLKLNEIMKIFLDKVLIPIDIQMTNLYHVLTESWSIRFVLANILNIGMSGTNGTLIEKIVEIKIRSNYVKFYWYTLNEIFFWIVGCLPRAIIPIIINKVMIIIITKTAIGRFKL